MTKMGYFLCFIDQNPYPNQGGNAVLTFLTNPLGLDRGFWTRKVIIFVIFDIFSDFALFDIFSEIPTKTRSGNTAPSGQKQWFINNLLTNLLKSPEGEKPLWQNMKITEKS